jgi:hypothetical protein
MTQPIPTVSRADVERVVRRDFRPNHVAEVLVILSRYGTDAWEAAPERVHLAALKLASGDVAALADHMAVAKADPRDVIAAAEYPEAVREWARLADTADADRQRVFDADEQQYQAWLRRPAP